MEERIVRTTLTLIGPSTLAVFGVAFLWAWAIERTRHYLLYLAAACALFTLGACVQIFYWPPDTGLNAVISCIFYTAAVLFATEAILVRSGQRFGLKTDLIVGALIVGLIWYFFYVDRNLLARVYIMNFGYGLILLSAAIKLQHLRHARYVDRALFWILLIFAVQFFPRTVMTIGFEAPTGGAMGFGLSMFWQVLQLSLAIFGSALAVAILAAALTDLIDDLRHERDTDGLTGVLNRRGFEDSANAILAQGQGPFSLVLCDIDHFKRINDTFGHDAGDAVLRAMGPLLGAAAGAGNLVGRIGGEEFAMLLHGQDSAAALRVAEKLRRAIARTAFPLPAGAPPVTASFGIAEAARYDTLDALMRRTDARLYRAKQAGRNRAVADDEPGAAAQEPKAPAASARQA